jgi:hypothetical protein
VIRAQSPLDLFVFAGPSGFAPGTHRFRFVQIDTDGPTHPSPVPSVAR